MVCPFLALRGCLERDAKYGRNEPGTDARSLFADKKKARRTELFKVFDDRINC
jgi:hypothetical protein